MELRDRRARAERPGARRYRRGADHLGPDPARGLPPGRRRRHLEEAAHTRPSRFLRTSYRVQENLIWLAEAALVLGTPRTVLDLLDGQAAQTDWFRDHVSFRLGYTARRLAAMARGELGQPGEATEGLLAARAELAAAAGPGARPAGRGRRPVPRRARAAARRGRGRGGRAGPAGRGRGRGGGGDRSGPPRPAHGWTLVLLARAAARLGDTQRAAQCFRSVTDLAAAGVDPCHPVILTARCDEAERRTAVGDTRQAARLLAPVLDRTLLVHGRPPSARLTRC